MSRHAPNLFGPTVLRGGHFESILNAIESSHLGDGRPDYAQAGMIWSQKVYADPADTTSDVVAADLFLDSGTAGIPIGRFDFVTGKLSLDATAREMFGAAAYLDVGTDVGDVVTVQADGKLPALDASDLTNVPAPSSFPLPVSKRVAHLSDHQSSGAWRSGLAIMADGSAMIFGNAANGRAAQGSFNMQTLHRPARVIFAEPPQGVAVQHVSSGGNHWLRFSSGQVFFWGLNSRGEGGLGHTAPVYIATRIAGLDGHNVVDVSVGASGHNVNCHALYRTDARRLFGSGYNFFGQTGVDGAPTGTNAVVSTVTEVGVGTEWIDAGAVGANYGYSWGIDVNGQLHMWGQGRALGTGDVNLRAIPTHINTFGGVAITHVSGSIGDDARSGVQYGSRTLVRAENGKVYFVGDQDNGQGGIGNTTYYDTFQEIVGLGTDNEDVLTVGGHYGASFVRKAAGGVHSAGNNDTERAAVRGTTATQFDTFGPIAGLPASPISKMIAYGGWYHTHTFATLHESGEIYVGGSGANGRHGLGDNVARADMVRVPLPAGVTIADISCLGVGDEACLTARTTDGRMLVAGFGGDSQNGDPNVHSRGVLTEVHF